MWISKPPAEQLTNTPSRQQSNHPQSWTSKGGAGRTNPPWILKLLAKKVVFSISRDKKQISPLLAPPFGKNRSDARNPHNLKTPFGIFPELAW